MGILAVFIGSKSKKLVTEALGWEDIEKYFWSDSTTLLLWISSAFSVYPEHYFMVTYNEYPQRYMVHRYYQQCPMNFFLQRWTYFSEWNLSLKGTALKWHWLTVVFRFFPFVFINLITHFIHKAYKLSYFKVYYYIK